MVTTPAEFMLNGMLVVFVPLLQPIPKTEEPKELNIF
jgi:hypothetical protein